MSDDDDSSWIFANETVEQKAERQDRIKAWEIERASHRYREDDIVIPSEDKLYDYRPWEEHRDDEGYLHCDDAPAARCKDGVWFYMKHGYIHNADGPAAKVGYIDAPAYWYFYEGKELGKNEEGWIKLWRITKNKDLFRCLDWICPHGDTMHDLKNLLSIITQEDLQDVDLHRIGEVTADA